MNQVYPIRQSERILVLFIVQPIHFGEQHVLGEGKERACCVVNMLVYNTLHTENM